MVALDKKRLAKEIESSRRSALKARLAELSALIKAARAQRREAVKGVQVQCRVAREKLRTVCARRAQAAKLRGAEAVAARKREADEARETDKLLKSADRRHRVGVVKARSSALERRQESDDEVIRNLPESLVGVFQKMRKHVKGGPRRTRTEAFLEWVEENPGEVYAMQGEQAERDLAKLVAEHERATRLSRRKALAHDVPF
jgi:hypothetical protein